MLHTYSTPLRYKNFAGRERTTTLHFHITPREFTDWMIDHPTESASLLENFTEVQEQIEGDPNGETTTTQKLTMLKLVRLLAEISYGKPDEDGEVFHKGDSESFKYSAAYDAFRLFLFENTKELATFISTLLNQEVIGEYSERMAAIAQEAGEEQPTPQLNSAPSKDPKEMSREELLEAFKVKNNQ